MLTIDEALSLLERAVASRGEDYVYTAHYPDCVYYWDHGEREEGCIEAGVANPPSGKACLVAVALDLAGWSDRQFADLAGAAPEALGWALGAVAGHPGGDAVTTAKNAQLELVGETEVSEAAVRVFWAAQMVQDRNGATWGQALAAAREVAESLKAEAAS